MWWKRLIWLWKIIKQYLSNCGIHGVLYLVDDRLSYIERLFWLISCVACWVGCGIMIQGVINNFIYYPVAVTAETMYLEWETPFPTIAFCITTTAEMRNKYYKLNPGGFPRSSTPALLKATDKDLFAAFEEMKAPCSEFLVDCEWNGKKFNCCNEFKEFPKTGIGYCLAVNSQHIRHNGKPHMPFFVNGTVEYGDMVINIAINKATKRYIPNGIEVFILNNLQLPAVIADSESHQIKVKANKTARLEYTMQDTFNVERVKSVAIEHRKCRFPYEVEEDSLFDIYSSDSCEIEKFVKRMIQLCGCVSFYYPIPRGARACNGSEGACLFNNRMKILSTGTSNRCYPNCEGTLLSLNRVEPRAEEAPGADLARIEFTLLSHPTMRYRRYVVNDMLDVIVAVGSAIGLFMGASILSLFEIPYWLFVRRDRIS